MSNDWDDKPVGYKQPPEWTRFEKGRSGNPKGRPAKQKPAVAPAPTGVSALDDALRNEKDRLVTVNDAGGTNHVAMYKVLLRAMMNRAAKGDVHALRLAIKLVSELEERDALRQQAEQELQRKLFEHIRALKERQARLWDKVEGTGTEPDSPWPHPDDVLVDHDTMHWHIRGPYLKEDIPYFEYCRAERDSLFVRMALDLRMRKASDTNVNSIWDIWILWDIKLPKRWQITDKIETALSVFMMLPLRELRALVATYTQSAEKLRPASFSGRMDKETYRRVNSTMKPLLKHYGYRSFAEFEKSYERNGEAVAWPKEATTTGKVSPSASEDPASR